ncbi:unnamed protein product [Absidia cylindrospora]
MAAKEYDKNSNSNHSSLMTSNTPGPTNLMNGQPTLSNSRFPDYALQQNSATNTNTRISIPHPLTSAHWEPPLSSPPPPWNPSFSAGHG